MSRTCPSADGLRANSRLQKASLSTITGGAAGAIILFRKDAARARRHPENPEVVSRDDRPFDGAERSTPPQHRLAQREIAHREQPVQHLLPGGEFTIERVAHVDRLIVFQQLNLHQRGRVAHRKRAEDHRVQHLINRRIRADAERERQNRRRGEHRIVAQLSERVDQVLGQVVEEGEASLVAIRFVELRDGAEAAPRRRLRICRGEAAPFVIGNQQRKVCGNLASSSAPRPPSPENAGNEDAHPGHGSLRRSRAIISTVRDQLSVSAASCLRPVRVIE